MTNTILRILFSLAMIVNVIDIIIKIHNEDSETHPVYYISNIIKIVLYIALIGWSYSWKN